MATGLTLEYSNQADVLCILKCPPYIGQQTTEIDDFVIARMNPKMPEIEYLEILLFFRRLEQYGQLNLPTAATLHPANTPTPEAPTPPSAKNTPLTIKYNHPTDTLTINQRHPNPSQTKTQLTKGVSARTNPATNQIETLEIQNFKARAKKDCEIRIPINATLRPAYPTENIPPTPPK